MTILLVEDDLFFQRFYAGKLAERQYSVVVASNGEEGLLKAHQQQFNLILLDLIMPKVDGFMFLEARKKNQALSNTPVIVFSTLGQEQDIEKAKALGANAYVNKSYLDFEGLVKTIQTHIKE